jgi:hypothetical protein
LVCRLLVVVWGILKVLWTVTRMPFRWIDVLAKLLERQAELESSKNKKAHAA